MTSAETVPMVFRLHENAPELVREVLLERGWKEYSEREQEEGDWNLYWRTSVFRDVEFENILPWQRLNHHPKTLGITRKDWLARNLKRMKGTFGSALYDFSPTAYILPNDYTKFLGEYTKEKAANGGKPGYWICKPVDLSRGRGIFIFDDIKKLTYDSSVIVQRYISNPLLISGYKFDLRIYVCVRSFHPLTIYIYQEGLVRFATEKYQLTCLDNLYSHLTNTSINKFGPSYTTDKERVGPGCKWTMSKFRCFLHSQKFDEILLWQGINSIVTLTVLTIAPSLPFSPNCIELFGFDILIDDNFKPWLLEVNYSPALSLDCAADVTVKKRLLHDLVDLLNYKKIDSLRQSGYLREQYRHPCKSSAQALESTYPPVLLLPKCISTSHNTNSSKSFLDKLNFSSELHFDETKQLKSIELQCLKADWRSRSDAPCSTYSSEYVTVSKASKCPPLCKVPIQDSSVKPVSPKKDLSLTRKKHSSQGFSTLPPIHIQRYRTLTFHWNQNPPENIRPPTRVGDFILTFPFNEVTFKASQKKLNVKFVVQEIQRLRNRLMSSDKNKVRKRRESCLDKISDDKECFGTLLWGPRYPPLLSECCSTKG
ncbi:probable tubulin polyglutamylase TTLL2 [Lepisosteus oculatus]|uniref:probable tubulin polyglutamylase TTLL2 n=1 Tax=Lepisosteus oculatus TaxID=7918 RepID=UPI0035F51A33